jgi:hypothetical protein
MKKNLIAIACLCIFLTGCLNITEEIFLEKNGSGKYVSTMDMSKMKEMLDMVKAFAPDSSAGNMDLSKLDSISDMLGDFNGIPGITNIKKEKKDENTYVVSFNFKDISALNEAMKRKNKKDSATVQPKGDFFSFSPGQFNCNDTSLSGINDAMKDMNGAPSDNDSMAMAMTMIKGMMGDMKYTSIYHMPGKVTSFSNKLATLSEDGKTVTLVLNLFDESQQNKTLLNKIQYKK